MKKICFLFIFACSGVSASFAQQVDTSNYAIAKAHPGNYIIRSNGQKVILTQADIDYAKRKLGISIEKTGINKYYSLNRAENGDYYGVDNDGDGRIETVYVRGYRRKDGTYVRSHYRAKPRR